MGKAAMLMVIASTIVMIGVSKSRLDTEVNLEETQSEYENKVLAREAANSFFNILASKSMEDFEGFRISETNLNYHDAVLDFSAVGTSANEVGLIAVAYVGNASHGISARIQMKMGGKLDAVTIDGTLGNLKATGSKFHISGLDTDPGGMLGEGGESATYGIRATNAATAQAFLDNVDASQLTGITGDSEGVAMGTSSVITGPSGVNLNELYAEIKEYVANDMPGAAYLDGDHAFVGNEVLGDPYHPVVYHINGDLDLGGTITGYGVLLVEGNISVAHGTPRWEGLIYATGVNASGLGGSTEFKGTVDIYGALILRTQNFVECEEDDVDCTPLEDDGSNTLDFSINGDVNILYSSMALNRIRDNFASLSSSTNQKTFTLGEIREVSSQRSTSSDGEYTSYQNYTSTTSLD